MVTTTSDLSKCQFGSGASNVNITNFQYNVQNFNEDIMDSDEIIIGTYSFYPSSIGLPKGFGKS